MILTYLLLPIGFVLLVKGVDFLVDGASFFAKRFGVSAWLNNLLNLQNSFTHFL